MLGKVMKYEFRAAGRVLLPLFGLGIVLAGVLRLMVFISGKVSGTVGEILQGLAGTMGVFGIIAILLITTVWVVARFYQSLSSREAYLSFTLPVGIDAHLLGRLFVSTLYSIASGVVAFLCIVILIPNMFSALLNAPMQVSNMGQTTTMFLRDLPSGLLFSFLGWLLVTALLGSVTNLLLLYASIAIGTQFGRQRILGSVVGYAILNTAQSLLTLPIMSLGFLRSMGSEAATVAFMNNLVVGTLPEIFQNILNFMWGILAVVGAISLVFAVAEYFVTRYFFTKKLNVE